jgi:dihydrofolate reductase
MINWVSIDGYFAGPYGEYDWMVRDPEVDQALHEPQAGEAEAQPPDTMLLGNSTYTLFENSWPQIAKDPNAPPELHKMAEEVNGMTKLVFSRTRREVPWENSRLFHGNLIEEVKTLKQTDGTSILIFGSGSIVQQLAPEGLIDEYLIVVSPVVLGKGKSLFTDAGKQNLQLLEARSFPSGNVLLRYTL